MAKEADNVEELPAAPAQASQSKTGSLLPVILIVVLVPMITVGLWEFYMLPSLEKLASANGAIKAEAGKIHDPAKPQRGQIVQTYELNDIVANLSGSLKSRYIKVSFTLESHAIGFADHMQQNRAKLIDATLAVLSDLTLQDLEEPGVKNIVRNDLLNVFGQTLHSDMVEQLYFSEFVVQ